MQLESEVGEAELVTATRLLSSFAGADLTSRIGQLEQALRFQRRMDLPAALAGESIDSTLLRAAYLFKRVAGQINVTIHAVGILCCLPELLDADETIESLSLGAGNTGRKFDLVTDRRIAEFKFIHWKGGSEVIRQNALFKDFYGLAEEPTSKAKFLYVLDADHPLRFLQGGRSLSSVMSRNRKLWGEFVGKYGAQLKTVREYWAVKQSEVAIVDVAPHVPELLSAALPASTGARRRAQRAKLRSERGAVTYSASRLLFRSDIIESLSPTERFRIETPDGNFEMTCEDFHRVFANVAQSTSYRERGIYHYARTPEKASQFLRP